MLRSKVATFALGVVVCVSSVAVSRAEAQGDGDQRARLHFESGASYYEAGEYEDALREFQHAYELSQRPALFYNLSLCWQNLGDLQQAVDFLERYLAEVTEVPNRANLEIRLRNLRERLAAQTTTTTTTGTGTTTTTGATTTETGTTATTTTTTETGGSSETGTETGTTTTASGTGATITTTTSARAPAARGDTLNVGAIAGFSVAAVGVVMAAVFGGMTIAEDSRIAGMPCGIAGTCGQQTLGDLQTFAALTDVGFGVALAGAVVGLIFLVIGPGDGAPPAERASLEVTPLAGPDGAGLSLGGSF